MAFEILQDTCNKHLMITANDDIAIDGNIRDDRKLLAAWVVSSFVSRLDKPEVGTSLRDIGRDQMPANVGLFMDNVSVTSKPCTVPIAGFNHVYTSGITGSGKSCTSRVIIEEAAQYEDLNILILDPRNQAAGLFVPEDRESFLSLYHEFGMDRDSAHGYRFKYYAPGQNFGHQLPDDLAQLARGRSIVSFKWLDDRQRCERFTEILSAVFMFCSKEESPITRLLIIVEEAQCFTKKRVDDNAKKAAERAEIALDRMVRESRKYGCCVINISQTIKDFARDSASIRQNTNTKIFLHNSDREIDYAADFIGDGRQIIQLPPATAIVFNPAWGVIKVRIRPPYSKVWDFSAEDTRKLVTRGGALVAVLSSDAKRLLAEVGQYRSETGHGINLSQASERLGISSKRQLQQLVDELESKGFVRTRKLRERGQPRIIEPISSGGTD
ncbi:MAG: helicase HerA domain-containing protein [Candidatus Thorarchaeota archaeon]|jgi:DNA helicase HerA-like ATPase